MTLTRLGDAVSPVQGMDEQRLHAIFPESINPYHVANVGTQKEHGSPKGPCHYAGVAAFKTQTNPTKLHTSKRPFQQVIETRLNGSPNFSSPP